MAILIEGYTVVAQRARIQHLLDGEQITIPNATALADEGLWRCSFMTQSDAMSFLRTLESFGLNVSYGPDSDVVLVNELDGSVDPDCQWLLTGKWDRAVVAWLAGTEPGQLVTRNSFDRKVGSGLTFVSSADDHLEFLRMEGNVEVYRDKTTGKEVYVGRTETSVERLYETATGILREHWRDYGHAPLKGAAAEQVASAVGMLDRVLAQVSDNWRVHWFHGKGQMSLGNMTAAYDSFHRAAQLEQNEQAISRELAGVCLDLGKFAEAVEVAEHAVTLIPDNPELICNLALAHLLAGNIAAAQKSIEAAFRSNPQDSITARLHAVIGEVVAGSRRPPKSMADLQAQKPRRRSWQFWKK